MSDTLSKIALSKAQKAAGKIPPDLSVRVTALEQDAYDFNLRVQTIEDLIATGATGSLSIVTGVNFTAQSITTQTIHYSNGIITGVI